MYLQTEFQVPQWHREVIEQRLALTEFDTLTLYPYQSAAGDVVFYRLRTDHPGEAKRIRVCHFVGADMYMKEPDMPEAGKPLYNLPDVLAHPKEMLYWVEGEKCADLLNAYGLLATTSGGSSSDRQADLSPLRGRCVLVLPDNDKVGMDHAQRIATYVRGTGGEAGIVDIASLGLDEHGDIADYLDRFAHGDFQDLLSRLPLIRRTTPLVLVPASAIEPEPVQWLIRDLIPLKRITLFSGETATSKTTLALAIASAVTNGGALGGVDPVLFGRVLGHFCEDPLRDSVVPRLMANNVNRDLFLSIERLTKGGSFCARQHMPELMETLQIEQARRDVPPIRLLLLDNITDALHGDSHKNADVRQSLQPLIDIAQQMNIAIVASAHLNKNVTGSAISRVNGGVGMPALSRTTYMVHRNEDSAYPGGFVMQAVKTNVGERGHGWTYDLDSMDVRPDISAPKVSFVQRLQPRDGLLFEKKADRDVQETRGKVPNTFAPRSGFGITH